MMQRKKIFILISSFNLCHFAYGDVYKSHVSDSWYQPRGKNLQLQLLKLEKKALKRFNQKFDVEKIKAIIVPHAGFNYSGELASGVYKNLKPNVFDRIIILAPSHHLNFNGIAMPGLEYLWYKNPLGYIQLDTVMLKKFQKTSPLFFSNHHAHELEHAIEVQIPLIQKYCGRCKIVPLLVGSLDLGQIKLVAEIIGKLIDKKTLIVVSSDFTHYGKTFGFTPVISNVSDYIFNLDQQLIKAICDKNSVKFLQTIEQSGDHVCGKNSILILLSMIQAKCFGDVGCHVIGYDNSAPGQINPENCVSYVGMVISKEKIKKLSSV